MSQQESYPQGWSAEDDLRSSLDLRCRELKAALEQLEDERFVVEALSDRLDRIEDRVREQRRRWWDPRSTVNLWRIVSR